MRKGKNLILSVETAVSPSVYKAVAAAKECSFELDLELQEVASASSSSAREYVPKRTGWSMSVSGLVPGDDNTKEHPYALKSLMLNRTRVHVKFEDAGLTALSTGLSVNGYAYITSLSYAGNVGNVATYRATLQGSGELS